MSLPIVVCIAFVCWHFPVLLHIKRPYLWSDIAGRCLINNLNINCMLMSHILSMEQPVTVTLLRVFVLDNAHLLAVCFHSLFVYKWQDGCRRNFGDEWKLMSQRRSHYTPLWVWDRFIRCLGGGLHNWVPPTDFGDPVLLTFFPPQMWYCMPLCVI